MSNTLLQSGAIRPYTEDANVQFDDVYVSSLSWGDRAYRLMETYESSRYTLARGCLDCGPFVIEDGDIL